MASTAELLAEAAACLVKAAASLGATEEPEEDQEEETVKTPKSFKGSSYKDFPRLVKQVSGKSYTSDDEDR